MKNIINKHKSIIVLNGTPPSKAVVRLLNTGVPIIAADGAVKKVRALQLAPTCIVGDGDSYRHSGKKIKAQVITIPDQDTTDFEKCLLFAKENNLFPCLVLGISGGELDHTMGNVQAFLKHAQGQNLYFLDTYNREKGEKVGVKLGIPLTSNALTLELGVQRTISLVSFHDALVQTSGLCWELEQFKLMVDGVLGVRNVNVQPWVTFEVLDGKVLLIVEASDLLQGD